MFKGCRSSKEKYNVEGTGIYECTYVCMCVCTYVHEYVHMCIFMYIHTFIGKVHMYVHTYVHACVHTYAYICVHTYVHKYIRMHVRIIVIQSDDYCATGFGLDAHRKHIYFPSPIEGFIHQLTIDCYSTVHSSLVCFPYGLFLWPVWHPRVHGCCLNGLGAGWQVASWLKTSSKVNIDVRNWSGNILWGLQLKMTLVIRAIHVAWKIFVKLYPTLYHPTHLPYVGTLWYQFKDYLKWWLAIE